MTVDLFDMNPRDFIDGITFGGAATFFVISSVAFLGVEKEKEVPAWAGGFSLDVIHNRDSKSSTSISARGLLGLKVNEWSLRA